MSDDILPKTEVSFNASRRAEFEGGILYLNGVAFANISDLIARAESTGERGTAAESDAGESYFVFEPGRLVYNTLELCNFVHRCVAVETPPVILIRESAKICATEYVFSITYQLYHNFILPVHRSESIPHVSVVELLCLYSQGQWMARSLQQQEEKM